MRAYGKNKQQTDTCLRSLVPEVKSKKEEKAGYRRATYSKNLEKLQKEKHLVAATHTCKHRSKNVCNEAL